MRRRVVFSGLALAGAAGVYWFTSAGAREVRVDDADRARSVADGSGAERIVLAGDAAGGEGLPRTLEDLRRIGDRTGLETARRRLTETLEALPAQAAVGEDPSAGDSGAGRERGILCVLLSDACRRLEDADAALEYGRRGAEALPTSSSAHHTYARAVGLKMRIGGRIAALTNLGAYKRELQTAIDLDPGNAEARKEQILFFSFAPAPVGDPEGAIALARELAASDPLLGPECLARALWRAGRSDEAIGVCRAAIAEHPERGEFSWVLGGILEDLERVEEADREYAAAMTHEKDETYYQALFRRAALRVEGQLELPRALILIDEYLEAAPHWEWVRPMQEAHVIRGRALEPLGRRADARAAYEQALAVDPAHADARKRLEGLD